MVLQIIKSRPERNHQARRRIQRVLDTVRKADTAYDAGDPEARSGDQRRNEHVTENCEKLHMAKPGDLTIPIQRKQHRIQRRRFQQQFAARFKS